MENFIKKNALLAVVFLTGAAVLLIELSAIRILSPYFGNTIFSVSSVLGVILAALSLGYYFGGKLADKHPSTKWFFGIIFLSGLSVLLIQVITNFFLPLFAYDLSWVYGPLVSSVLLFLLPAVLMGTLSPYVITLQQARSPKEGVGTVSGKVFFWSTLGSIAGSLGTGFYLIPTFGIDQIVVATGLGLVLLGGIPLLRIKTPTSMKVWGLVVFALIGGLLLFPPSADEASLHEEEGLYEKITIKNIDFRGQPARVLIQDRSLSGGILLGSDELPFDYSKYYQLYREFAPNPERALFLGGGSYSTPMALLREDPNVMIDVVEIEPSLFDLAKEYFGATDDPRLRNHVQDGRRFLHDSNGEYDLIFSDVFRTYYSIPSHMTTTEFFTLMREKLSDDGVFVANVIGNLSRQSPSLLWSEIVTFQEVFPNTYLFAVDGTGSIQTQNMILVGVKEKRQYTREDFAAHPDPFIRSVAEHLVDMDRFELSEYQRLSDNFAPVDSLTSTMISRDVTLTNHKTNSTEMMELIAQQLRYGPRWSGSQGHQQTQAFIRGELAAHVDEVRTQSWDQDMDGTVVPLTNIIGRLNPHAKQRILLGTHYDTKRFANLDTSQPEEPVPGANDGASGVAVLLDVVRVLNNVGLPPDIGVDIVFFDGEEGKQWVEGNDDWVAYGSVYFADHLDEFYTTSGPDEVIIADMVCEAFLRLPREASSVQQAPDLVDRIWSIGKQVDSMIFIDTTSPVILDDHTAFQEQGIPAALMIDLNYGDFHTTHDQIDNCSEKSLAAVAQTLVEYVTDME